MPLADTLHAATRGARHAAGVARNLPRLASWVLRHTLLDTTPTPESAYDLMWILLGMASDDDLAEAEEIMGGSPTIQAFLQERYLPEPYTLDDLAHLPEHTLGAAYRRHMVDNGLSIDFFVNDPIDDEAAYMRRRAWQVHDYWHVLTGYGTSEIDELGIVGFTIGNYTATLGRAGSMMNQVLALLYGSSVIRFALHRRDDLTPMLERFAEGLSRGAAARCLLDARFETWWEEPLEDVRARLGVIPLAADVPLRRAAG